MQLAKETSGDEDCGGVADGDEQEAWVAKDSGVGELRLLGLVIHHWPDIVAKWVRLPPPLPNNL